MQATLKAPFPYMGGKASIAQVVWEALGDPGVYIEPFAGSAAVLLARPTAPKVETINDASGQIVFVHGRAALERLIGGIQTLTLWPPHPVLMPLLPSQWGQQLVGSKAHTKADVARIVNLRLRTAYRGDFHDNHTADAVGIALVAQDTLRQTTYRVAHRREEQHHAR